jgi:hypothetical protein
MNAAERMWRGLVRRDWEAVRAQFHTTAVIERPGRGAPLDVDEFVAEHRVEATHDEREVEVLRTMVDGTTCVIEARAGAARCAGFYDLHEGRIARATEYWV